MQGPPGFLPRALTAMPEPTHCRRLPKAPRPQAPQGHLLALSTLAGGVLPRWPAWKSPTAQGWEGRLRVPGVGILAKGRAVQTPLLPLEGSEHSRILSLGQRV